MSAFIEKSCDNVEQAKKDYPHLQNALETVVTTKDGEIILFTGVALTDDDFKAFKEFTTKEVVAIFGEYLRS